MDSLPWSSTSDATLTAETAPAKIRELRAGLLTVTDQRRHTELMGQLEQAYKILHPDIEAPPIAGALAMPPIPLELGRTNDRDVLAELGPRHWRRWRAAR